MSISDIHYKHIPFLIRPFLNFIMIMLSLNMDRVLKECMCLTLTLVEMANCQRYEQKMTKPNPLTVTGIVSVRILKNVYFGVDGWENQYCLKKTTPIC